MWNRFQKSTPESTLKCISNADSLATVSEASRLTFGRYGASRSKPGRLAYVSKASRLTFRRCGFLVANLRN